MMLNIVTLINKKRLYFIMSLNVRVKIIDGETHPWWVPKKKIKSTICLQLALRYLILSEIQKVRLKKMSAVFFISNIIYRGQSR